MGCNFPQVENALFCYVSFPNMTIQPEMEMNLIIQRYVDSINKVNLVMTLAITSNHYVSYFL